MAKTENINTKMSDNFKVEIHSSGREHFETALTLAWKHAPGGYAITYAIDPDPNLGLVFFWSDTDKTVGEKATKIAPLPYRMNLKAAIEFAWNWLDTAEYPDEPDHDGSNSKGFVVSTGNHWGHIGGSHFAIVSVSPTWMMHGK